MCVLSVQRAIESKIFDDDDDDDDSRFINAGETDIDECEVDKIDCGGRGFCINTHGSYR